MNLKACAFQGVTLLTLVGLAPQAFAATTTTTFDVTATVAASCSVSAADVAFGTYDPTLGNTAQATITANCTPATDYSIALDFGGAADVNSRVMDGPNSNTLSYQLYQDLARTTVWGTGADVNNDITTTGTGLDVSHIVYGSLPSGQNVEAGSYTDTITVTLTY